MAEDILIPGQLSLSQLRIIYLAPQELTLSTGADDVIATSQATVTALLSTGTAIYGINTGFGLLAQTSVPNTELEPLQRNLLLSHCTGVGAPLSDAVVRLILVLKISSLARGYSGVRRQTIDALLALLNHEVYPVIPSKGSVGASGDLAPLAHMSAVLLGEGSVRHNGHVISAVDGLKIAGLSPMSLAPKEGLALINGTQVSTALALAGLFATEHVFAAAIVAGALSIDALRGSDIPFDPRIQAIRGHQGQIDVAETYRALLTGSAIRASHLHCPRVQDPYSLRCQPQVMGACLDTIRHVSHVLETEANAVTDNPLIFTDSQEALSGGNFHAEPVAFAADMLALALAEIANLSERRLSLMVDPKMSGLPAFLVQNSGLNSGFMIAQVTAAALASENKSLAHPASVDSIPTSANQEDHVSMATFAARRLSDMASNSSAVVAIEILAAVQGIDFHHPLITSEILDDVCKIVRQDIDHYDSDRYFKPDIDAAIALVENGIFYPYAESILPSRAKL